MPILAMAAGDGIVPCKGTDCTFEDIGKMLQNIYDFIIKIATPLAIIAITVGGIMMMISAGNPNMMSIGKKVFWSAVIGLFLAFGSYALIKFIVNAMKGSSGS